MNPPFYLITDEIDNGSSKKLTNKLKIVLAKYSQTPIRIYFEFNRNEDRNSRIFKEILLFEYDENLTKVSIYIKRKLNEN